MLWQLDSGAQLLRLLMVGGLINDYTIVVVVNIKTQTFNYHYNNFFPWLFQNKKCPKAIRTQTHEEWWIAITRAFRVARTLYFHNHYNGLLSFGSIPCNLFYFRKQTNKVDKDKVVNVAHVCSRKANRGTK